MYQQTDIQSGASVRLHPPRHNRRRTGLSSHTPCVERDNCLMQLSDTNNLEIYTWSQNKRVRPNTHNNTECDLCLTLRLEVSQKLQCLRERLLVDSLTSSTYSAMNTSPVCVTAIRQVVAYLWCLLRPMMALLTGLFWPAGLTTAHTCDAGSGVICRSHKRRVPVVN